MDSPSRPGRVWTVGEAKERLPEILHLAETEGPQHIVAKRTFVVSPVSTIPNELSEKVEVFDMKDTAKLLQMDAAHNPALADYWRDESDDDLIATANRGDIHRIIGSLSGGDRARTRQLVKDVISL